MSCFLDLDRLTGQRPHHVSVDGVLHMVAMAVWLVLALALVKNPKEEHVLLVDVHLLPGSIQAA